MNTNKIPQVFSPINFLFKNFRIYKFFTTLFFVLYAPLHLSWIYWQLTKVQLVCYTEIISGMIFMAIYSVIAGFSGIYYCLICQNKLIKLVSKIQHDIRNLTLYFSRNISFHRQRQLVRCSVITLTLFKFSYLILEVIFTRNRPGLRTYRFVVFVLNCTSGSMLWLWIRLLTFVVLVLLSIVGYQIQELIRVKCKSSWTYAKLNVEIFEQSSLLNQIFGVIVLAMIAHSFGDLFITLWTMSEPKGSYVLGDSWYILTSCCLWNIAIVETGEQVNKEVRTF